VCTIPSLFIFLQVVIYVYIMELNCRQHMPPPRTRSRIALRRGAFLGSALPHEKLRSLVFEGALRERLGRERSLERSQGKKTLPEPARVRRRKLVFLGGFFGEMTHGKGSLGLAKTTKHSFTPISLILFLISSISLLRGF
jgi:hypothetical protein